MTTSSLDDNDLVEGPKVTLHNGIEMPLIGLGGASGVRRKHVQEALRTGYRLVDTAQAYRWGYHEDEVGVALADFLENEGKNYDVFVQTKIDPEELGYDSTIRAVYQSIERLNGHLDSVLIHKPRCWDGACRKEPEGTWQESWKALEDLYDQGVVKAIGICDVDNNLLDELLGQRVRPHIVQSKEDELLHICIHSKKSNHLLISRTVLLEDWMDPLHQDSHIRDRCLQNGIQYQAYSSLGTQWVHHKGFKGNPVLENPTLVEIATSHNTDVASIVLTWAVKHGISVLPASRNPIRQQSNLESASLINLSEEEMSLIDDLDGKVPQLRKLQQRNGEVKIHFDNPRQDGGAIEIFWVGSKENKGNEVPVGSIAAGDRLSLNSYHGHRFLFRDPTNGNSILGDYVVNAEKASSGEQQHIVPYYGEL